MTMALSAKQVAELEKPLSQKHVVQRKHSSGAPLSYIEGWHAIAEANRIFGFDGWTRETVEMREVRSPEQVKGRSGGMTWRVGFMAKVRVKVGDIVREGTGFGSGALPDLGEAYESAVKEAETDAMKRALMTFGNPFGLALYDKTRANVEADAPHDDRPIRRPPSPPPVHREGWPTEKYEKFEAALGECASHDEIVRLGEDWDASTEDPVIKAMVTKRWREVAPANGAAR